MRRWSRLGSVSGLVVTGLVVVAGCGNVTVTDAAADGASSDTSAARDAGVARDAAEAAVDGTPDRPDAADDHAPGPCDPMAAFGAAALLDDFNTTSNDDAVFLSEDQLTALV